MEQETVLEPPTDNTQNRNGDGKAPSRIAWLRPDPDEPRLKRGDAVGIVLEHSGNADAKPIRDLEHKSRTGTYIAQARGRYWNDKPIPRGYIWVWMEGNPVPIQENPPDGYSAKHMATITGPELAHAIGAAFKSGQGPALGRVGRWALIAAGLGLLALMWANGQFGVGA